METFTIEFKPGDGLPLTEISPEASAVCVRVDGGKFEDAKYCNAIYEAIVADQKCSKPGLLMEVTGSQQNFAYIDQSALVNFNYGFVQAAKIANAWIVTNGIRRGITKLVGDAVGQARLMQPDLKLICLAIAPAHRIKNEDTLFPNGYRRSVTYAIDNEEPDCIAQRYHLDPNNNAVLLVSHGRFKQFSGHFLGRLSVDNSPIVPRMLLVIGGDQSTLDTLAEALDIELPPTASPVSPKCKSKLKNSDCPNRKRPVVLLKGFRGIADLLSFAFEITDPDQQEDIDELVYEFFDDSLESCEESKDDFSEKPAKSSTPARDGGIEMTPPLTPYFERPELFFNWPTPSKSALFQADHVVEPVIPADFDEQIRQHREMSVLLQPFANDANLREIEANRIVDFVKEFVTQRSLISVYDIFSKNEGMDSKTTGFLTTLLQAIFKAELYPPGVLFKLAWIWKRTDFARAILRKYFHAIKLYLNENCYDERGVAMTRCEQLMLEAICKGNNDFCKLLDDYNLICFRKFLTRQRLQEIYYKYSVREIGSVLATIIECYIDNPYSEELHSILTSQRDEFTALPPVSSPVCNRRLTDKIAVSQSSVSDPERKPYLCGLRDVFLFALLTGCDQLAVSIWLEGLDQIGSALLAHSLLWGISIRAENIDMANKFSKRSKEWKQRAIDLLEKCYQIDAELTDGLLGHGLATWQRYSILEIAYFIPEREFLSQNAVQKKVDALWKKPSRGALPPATKFYIHSAVTLLSLVLFSLLAINDLDRWRSGNVWQMSLLKCVDIYVVLWCFVSLLQKIVEDFGDPLLNQTSEKFRYFIHQFRSVIEIGACVFLALAYFLLMTNVNDKTKVFKVCRVLLAVSCSLAWFKVFYIFSVFNGVGVKVLTLRMLLYDLIVFVFLYAVVYIIFSILMFALSSSEIEPSSGWQYLNSTSELWWAVVQIAEAPERFEDNNPIRLLANMMFGAYLIVINIILINFLIAILSARVEEVRQQSNQHHRYNSFYLTREYSRKSLLPPPFTVFEWIFFCYQPSNQLKQHFEFNDINYLRLSSFERNAALDLVAGGNGKKPVE